MSDTPGLKECKILPMTHRDLEDVFTIERFSFPIPWPKSQFEKELQNQYSFPYVVKIRSGERERVAAYIIFWIVTDQAHILNIATHPDFRRQGIAKNLLTFALKILKEREVKEIFLEVRKSNVNAQRLYRDFGFEEIGVRKGYYVNNKEDAIVMVRRIAKQGFDSGRGV